MLGQPKRTSLQVRNLILRFPWTCALVQRGSAKPRANLTFVGHLRVNLVPCIALPERDALEVPLDCLLNHFFQRHILREHLPLITPREGPTQAVARAGAVDVTPTKYDHPD